MKREPLFDGCWYDLRGGKLRRATRLELREAHRLWVIHTDLRTQAELVRASLARVGRDADDRGTR
jgi:hypothetical protein